MSQELPPPMPDGPLRRGLLRLVDGLLATRFGAAPGDAGDRALARLRGDAPRRAPAPATATRISARTRARRRAYRRAPGAGLLVASAAAALLVVAALIAIGRGGDEPREPREVRRPAPPTTTAPAPIPTASSARTLVLADGSEIQASGDAVVAREDGDRTIRLASGRIRVVARPQRPEAPLRVVTPALETAVVGTAFTVEHRDGLSAVAVEHGRVRVRRGAAQVELGAGEATRSLELSPWTVAAPGTLAPGQLAVEPASALAASARACAPSPTRAAGLLAQYFDGVDLARPRLTRVDAEVDFHWRPYGGDADAPIADPAAQATFSARWSGSVEAPAAGDYVFVVTADDGARLWLDGRLVIDDWAIHPPHLSRAAMALAAGPHALVLEYCQHRDHCELALEWIPPGGIRATVPAARLSHAAGDAP